VEHRAARTPRQRTLFWAAFFSWVHVILAAFASLSTDLLHVCFGLPTFLFPCGFRTDLLPIYVTSCFILFLYFGCRAEKQSTISFTLFVGYSVCFKLFACLISAVTCPKCQYICSTAASLKNHLRTHSDEKPFCCDYCSYSAKQRGNVKSHIRKRHPEKLRSSRRHGRPKGSRYSVVSKQFILLTYPNHIL
jgi:hypothetical protein